MNSDTMPLAAKEISVERQMLKRSLTLLPLFGIIYFTICGGTFGIESLFSYSGAGMALLLIGIVPFVYSIPNMLMVRELQSMMPVEGSYYHWTKQGFNPLTGFMTAWMNWVMSWVDVAIYPVLGATYLSFFIPQLRDGWGPVPAWVLQWIVALIIIWGISALQIRGARLAGMTSIWLGVILIIPLVIMSVVGFYNWGAHGSAFQMSFLPQDTGMTGAFAVGLFVVMWNYMGWELPTSAGDEIVKPKRTYPLAMVLVLIAAIATYAIPTVAALYGGAGDNNKVLLWGITEEEQGAGIGPVLQDAGMTPEQMAAAGVDPTSSDGWGLPDIAKAVGETATHSGSGFAVFLGDFMMIAAILSMIGLFIGNSVSATRIPFALSEDGMMPKFLVRVNRKFGTPWIAIILCGVIFSVFSLNAFAALVVIDVLLNSLTLLIQFLALWRLRIIRPDIPRSRIPGGWVGLFIATVLPAAVIILAIYSQVTEEGLRAIYWAVAAIAVGAILYFPIKKYIKPGIPDIDPYVSDEDVPAMGPGAALVE
jgi:amino acid transporter